MGKKATLFILLLGLAHPVRAELVVNGDTVTDTVTCLEWQRATADTNGDGTPDPMNWQNALAYAEGLSLGGHTDWRLPDYNELASIVDYSRYSPAIDTAAFPDTLSGYWSSTTCTFYTSTAWLVGFSNGYGSNSYKSSSFFVRAVRGGQCGFGITHTVTASANPPEGGNVTGGGTYNEGDTATLAATASQGYRFTNWSGDVSGSTNPLQVTVDGDKTIIANFEQKNSIKGMMFPIMSKNGQVIIINLKRQ